MSDRSPSLWRISTAVDDSRSPAMRISCTVRATPDHRRERERPVLRGCRRIHAEIALERGAIAGERGADALDERQRPAGSRAATARACAPALRRSARRYRAAASRGFGSSVRFSSRSGALVVELTGGRERMIEHRQVLYFGEGDVPVRGARPAAAAVARTPDRSAPAAPRTWQDSRARRQQRAPAARASARRSGARALTPAGGPRRVSPAQLSRAVPEVVEVEPVVGIAATERLELGRVALDAGAHRALARRRGRAARSPRARGTPRDSGCRRGTARS